MMNRIKFLLTKKKFKKILKLISYKDGDKSDVISKTLFKNYFMLIILVFTRCEDHLQKNSCRK